MLMRRFIASCALLLLPCTAALASNVAKLQQYLSETRSLQASFVQTVSPKNGKVQISNGQLQLVRPGKFRWVYNKPFPQEIISDGKQVWLYDPELAQVTIKSVGKALEASPAAILAGNNQLDASFNSKDLPPRDGLQWVELSPKQNDSSFAKIRLGFTDKELNRMELDDHFGQSTLIQMQQIVRNKAIPAHLFTFTPPAGSDIIRE